MAEAGDDVIRVELVHAGEHRVRSCTLTLPVGATVAEALERADLVHMWPEVCVRDDCLGVFGRRVKPDRALRDGDRVEVYRPLHLDPMEARRRRAQSRG